MPYSWNYGNLDISHYQIVCTYRSTIGVKWLNWYHTRNPTNSINPDLPRSSQPMHFCVIFVSSFIFMIVKPAKRKEDRYFTSTWIIFHKHNIGHILYFWIHSVSCHPMIMCKTTQRAYKTHWLEVRSFQEHSSPLHDGTMLWACFSLIQYSSFFLLFKKVFTPYRGFFEQRENNY